MTAPRVTVLMSVHNGEAFVAEAVDSILRQTFRDFELLAIDDGSTDTTADILDRYDDSRVRVLRNEENIGLTRSLNLGLAAARGEFVARQDADDLSEPERLACQVAFLDENGDVALVGAQGRGVDDDGKFFSLSGWPKSTSSLAIRWQLMFDSPFVHTAVMFRRRVVWQILGGYNETFRASQDFELWSRMAERYNLRNLPDELIVFRARRDSVSRLYKDEDVMRVHEVLRQNRAYWLQSTELAVLGLDQWVAVNNPTTLGPASDIGLLADADVAMFRRFVEIYPEASRDREIRRHRAVSLARSATLGAQQGAAGSASLFARACTIQPGVLSTWGSRFLAHSVLRRCRSLVGLVKSER